MKQPVDSRLPRVAFDFIVKRDVEVFVLSVAEKNDLYLTVGVDVLDDPRKIKIKAKISIENPF